MDSAVRSGFPTRRAIRVRPGECESGCHEAEEDHRLALQALPELFARGRAEVMRPRSPIGATVLASVMRPRGPIGSTVLASVMRPRGPIGSTVLARLRA